MNCANMDNIPLSNSMISAHDKWKAKCEVSEKVLPLALEYIKSIDSLE
jgi:hypothetical protein